MIMRIVPHQQVVATFTGTRLPAVQNILHGQHRGGPGPLPPDVDTVCKISGAGLNIAQDPTGMKRSLWEGHAPKGRAGEGCPGYRSG